MEHSSVRKFVWIATLLTAALPAAAQLTNSSLTGAYNFRYVGILSSTGGAQCDCPVSYIGTVTFDGKGGYTLNSASSGQGGIYVATSGGANQTLVPSTSGTYVVYSSGMFSMDDPFAPSNNPTTLFGGVGQGAVVASSTESLYMDMFVAMPAAT